MDGVACIRGLRIPVATIMGTKLGRRSSSSGMAANVDPTIRHLLKANLPQLEQALKAGSIVVINPDRIRIRALPLPP